MDAIHDEVLAGNVVRELRLIDRRASWSRTVAVGEAVINVFFEGSCERFKSSPHRAHQSLRCIAAHAGCPLKKSALASAVQVYAFVVEHPQVRDWEHVLPGHVVAVLKCPGDERLSLLQQVHREGTTVKALSMQVAIRSDAPRKMRALPATCSPASVVSALRSIERELYRIAEIISRPSSWLDPGLARAHAVIDRLDGSLAEAASAIPA